MTIDYTVPMLGGGGLGPASYPADGGFNFPRQTLQYYGDLQFPAGGGNYPAYQFNGLPGSSARPAPLSPAGIPMTPMGPTPSQYAMPAASGPYGLLAQQLAGAQMLGPNAPAPNGGALTPPPKRGGLLMS